VLLSLLFLLLNVGPARAADELLVSAAASLTGAFSEIGTAYRNANPGIRVVFNFAASGALLQQIEKGAPVDVFAAADQETMNRAAHDGLIDPATRRDFTGNRLVLVVPSGSTAAISAVDDLARPEVRRIAVGKPASVPAGRYTRDALGAARWDALAPKFVYAESVRQALRYASLGEVDAAFVYASDAQSAPDRVRVAATVATPRPLAYPAAVVALSPRKAAAAAFLDFILSAPAQGILRRHGFGS
jgi:molybdate transport system substrate-binding protein